MKERKGISVIIPVAAGDESWRQLLPGLRFLSLSDEIILSAAGSLAVELKIFLDMIELPCSCFAIHVVESSGRAQQLNSAVAVAKNDFFWFLHSDSRISGQAFEFLKAAIEKKPEALHFFNLLFLDDGPMLVWLNAFGAWFRSRILRLPFGDQGFCVGRTTFFNLDGFDEEASYGEDHLLVWRAHQNKIELNCVGASIRTSARKYKINGWSQTTKRHVLLTMKQALPELIVFFKQRIL